MDASTSAPEPAAMYLELLPHCRAAVDDFRAEHGILEPVQTIEWTGAYWQRQR